MTDFYADDALSVASKDAQSPHTLLRNELRFEESSDSFPSAWKRGIALAGPSLFDRGARPTPSVDPQKRDLRPCTKLIRRAIGPMSPPEKIFLAALVSCHDAKEGGLLLQRSEFHGFADFGRLDVLRRGVLCSLILHLTPHFDFCAKDERDNPLPMGAVDDASPWDEMERESRHFEKADEYFLSSWRRSVLLAGPHLFGREPVADVENASTKWDLCPKVCLIATAIGALEKPEQLFLAILVSFYNSVDGGQLLQRIGFRGLADMVQLDRIHRACVSGLILNYAGW